MAGCSTKVKIPLLYNISMTQLRSPSNSLACVTEHSSIIRQIEMCASMTSIQQYHFLFTCHVTPGRLYKKYIKKNLVQKASFQKTKLRMSIAIILPSRLFLWLIGERYFSSFVRYLFFSCSSYGFCVHRNVAQHSEIHARGNLTVIQVLKIIGILPSSRCRGVKLEGVQL